MQKFIVITVATIFMGLGSVAFAQDRPVSDAPKPSEKTAEKPDPKTETAKRDFESVFDKAADEVRNMPEGCKPKPAQSEPVA